MELHKRRTIIKESLPLPLFHYTLSFSGHLVQTHFEFIYYYTEKVIRVIPVTAQTVHTWKQDVHNVQVCIEEKHTRSATCI